MSYTPSDSGRRITIPEALSPARGILKSGARVVAAMAAAEPRGLLEHIGDHCDGLSNVSLYCANPSRDYPCFTDDSLAGRLAINVMFLTAKVRDLQGHGRIHYVPQHLSQWVRNLTRAHSIDVFWGTCSPPDQRGFVSLGTGSCYEPEILRRAKVVVLEVNRNVPVTSGATTIPISWVDHLIDYDHDLPTVPRPQITDLDRRIAGFVAELVPDRATLQLGIGAIPNAIGEALAGHRDLGIHTEMINDTIMDLCLKGVVTGRAKSIWPGKIVGSFVYGTRELYDFVDNNPAIDLQPSSVVNDPVRIGRNHRMVSINSAVEIDLTGQVCAESVGHTELSGVGGAFETHVGAQRSDGGRGIIAIHSTSPARGAPGEPPRLRSKIVFELKPGAKVSVSRNDVDTIVTEYGVAQLAGLSVAQRVRAMVSVAHPEFREMLLEQARGAGYL